ncbi:hypothetical protein ACMATS_26820 [Streptoverticillium reticulum]|uniref:hypothetical protein n=1 Tax=Streptoverticillium reticulum TaxID=1433415 RepID=UPI0039BEF5CC
MSTPQPPQRPPRPDEVLAFHNGDTLENIPVIRGDDPPQRFPWKAAMAGGAVAVVIGACAALLVRQPTGNARVADVEAHPQATRTADGAGRAKAADGSPLPTPLPAASTAPSCLHVTYKLPSGPAGCEPKTAVCTPGAPWHVVDIEGLCGGPTPLQAIHVISEPATGGDPGSLYCLAWTGSEDGSGKYATLLMNAPGFQCGANLVGADGQAIQAGGTSVFYSSVPDCAESYPDTRMTYPAVLDFPSDGGERPPTYVCVVTHAGA